MLLSSIASLALATPADTPYVMTLQLARRIAVDLMALDSLSAERRLLAERIARLEDYRQQSEQRHHAMQQQLQLGVEIQEHKDAQLVAIATVAEHYATDARRYKRQRNVAIVSGGVLAVFLVKGLIRKSAHPP